MRVLIYSDRFCADTHTITHMLDLYARTQAINVLIHRRHRALGGAIENWAHGIDVHVTRYPAGRALHEKYVETRRNLFMLEDGHPDVLLAFPGGENTAKYIKMVKNREIRIIDIAQPEWMKFDDHGHRRAPAGEVLNNSLDD